MDPLQFHYDDVFRGWRCYWDPEGPCGFSEKSKTGALGDLIDQCDDERRGPLLLDAIVAAMNPPTSDRGGHEHSFCPHCNPCRHGTAIDERDALRGAMVGLASLYGTGPGGGSFTSLEDMVERIKEGVDAIVRVETGRARSEAPTNRDSRLAIACAALEFIVNDYPRQTNEGAQRKAAEALAQIGPARGTEKLCACTAACVDPERQNGDECRMRLGSLKPARYGPNGGPGTIRCAQTTCGCMDLPGCARLGRCRVAYPPLPGGTSK